ncbi:MAG: hypothetical protein CMJ46_08600 [Planctomyces sp.]|nr:hypothetical protein [Planctomyces sp.]
MSVPFTRADANWALADLFMARAKIDPEQQSKLSADAYQRYSRARRAYTEAEFPYEWALLHHAQGIAKLTMENAQSLSHRAVAFRHFQEALSVFEPTNYPAKLAMVLESLGNACAVNSAERTQEENDLAVACSQGVQILRNGSKDETIFWSELRNKLSKLFDRVTRIRMELDWNDTLRQSLSEYHTVLRQDIFPLPSSECSQEHHHRTGRHSDLLHLREAEEGYRRVLTSITESSEPETWAAVHHQLGLVLLEIAHHPELQASRDEKYRQYAFHYLRESARSYLTQGEEHLAARIQHFIELELADLM